MLKKWIRINLFHKKQNIMFERIKKLFMRKWISKVVVDTLREQNSRLKERVAELEQAQEKKFCPYCKERKPITEFNKNKSKKDGLQTCCRSCHRTMTSKMPKQEMENYKFTPSRNEFVWWYVNVSERYITYEIHDKKYPIIDSFRFHYLSEKFGEELVKQKIEQMIKYFNKNNLRKDEEDLYYKLKARCTKEQILQNEKQQLNLFQNSESEWKMIHS